VGIGPATTGPAASQTRGVQGATYWGTEAAYATAKPQTSTYKTKGFAFGAFGGVEYRLSRHLSINADLGPYVISLHESQTSTGSTNLDFVVNSAFLVKL